MKQELIRIADIPDYIHQITGVRKTRQTVYRWIKQGKLKSTTQLGQIFSKSEWIDDFISST